MHDIKERLVVFAAWLTPRRIAYWCAVRVFAHGTLGKYSDTDVPSLTCAEALKRWED